MQVRIDERHKPQLRERAFIKETTIPKVVDEIIDKALARRQPKNKGGK